jgi:hypothetical protein
MITTGTEGIVITKGVMVTIKITIMVKIVETMIEIEAVTTKEGVETMIKTELVITTDAQPEPVSNREFGRNIVNERGKSCKIDLKKIHLQA